MKHADKMSFLRMVAGFHESAQRLNDLWQTIQDLPEDGLASMYPFPVSFDQIVYDIQLWQESVNKVMSGVQTEDEPPTFTVMCEVGHYIVNAITGDVIQLIYKDDNVLRTHDYDQVVKFDLDEHRTAYAQPLESYATYTMDFKDFNFHRKSGEYWLHNDKFRKERIKDAELVGTGSNSLPEDELKDGTDPQAGQEEADGAEIGMIAAIISRNLDLDLPEYKSINGVMDTFARVGNAAAAFESKYRHVVEWSTYLETYYPLVTDWEEFVIQWGSEWLINCKRSE